MLVNVPIVSNAPNPCNTLYIIYSSGIDANGVVDERVETCLRLPLWNGRICKKNDVLGGTYIVKNAMGGLNRSQRG